jgi:hypothetical protein
MPVKTLGRLRLFLLLRQLPLLPEFLPFGPPFPLPTAELPLLLPELRGEPWVALPSEGSPIELVAEALPAPVTGRAERAPSRITMSGLTDIYSRRLSNGEDGVAAITMVVNFDLAALDTYRGAGLESMDRKLLPLTTDAFELVHVVCCDLTDAA